MLLIPHFKPRKRAAYEEKNKMVIVLGAMQGIVTDANQATSPGTYWVQSTYENLPLPWGILVVTGSSYIMQTYISVRGGEFQGIWMRISSSAGTTWYDWKSITYDLPSFYKNYATLTALRTAIGKMEFVDMGLPSGRLWASKNIGAETITDYGYYFSWGNVQGHKPNGTTFDYNFGTSIDGPYASTEGAALTTDIPEQQDAANYYLGGNCRMPTQDEFIELFNSNYTKFIDATGAEVTGTNKLITLHGVVGIYLMSKVNGNKLFFPCAGGGYGSSLDNVGSHGLYWSGSRYSDAYGRRLNFNSGGVNSQNSGNRYDGFPVRAVQ